MKKIILLILLGSLVAPTYSFESKSLFDKNVIIPACIFVAGGIAWHFNRLSWKKGHAQCVDGKKRIEDELKASNERKKILLVQLRAGRIDVDYEPAQKKWVITNNYQIKAAVLEKERDEWKERANNDRNYNFLAQIKKCAKSITLYELNPESQSLLDSLGYQRQGIISKFINANTFENNPKINSFPVIAQKENKSLPEVVVDIDKLRNEMSTKQNGSAV